MATENIASKAYWLYIDPAGGTDYSNLVCGLNMTFNQTNSASTRQTFCGPKSNPGDQSSTISFNGEIMKDPTTGELSAPDVFTLSNGATTFTWKIQAQNPTDGDATKTGSGFFSSYSETYDSANVAGFSATITVDGDIVQTIETGS